MLGKRRLGWALRLLAIDAAMLIGCFVVAHQVRVLLNRPLGLVAPPLVNYLWLLALVLPVWLGLVGAMGGYGLRWLDRSRGWLALRVSAVGLLVLPALLFLSRQEINRSLLVLFAGGSAAGLWLERRLVQAWLRERRRDGRLLRHALVVGPEEAAARIIAALQQYPEAGWTVLGWVSLDPAGGALGAVPWLGALAALPELLEEERVVDEVFFAAPPEQLERLTEALQACEHLGIDTRVLVDLYRPAHARPFVEELFGLPFYGFSPTLASQGALAVKRTLDLTGAGLLLLIALPLLLATALLIRATSPGPALFRQERAGLRGRRFTIYKFRTMVLGAEAMRAQLAHLNEMAEPVFKVRNDPRLTPLGRVLRRASLDELPQLVNVLRGEMSLVGPRPLPVYEASRIKGAQRRRLAMRPGITGLWQVSGRTGVDFETWMRLDLEYVDRWSLALDLRILARTARTVLLGQGAY